MVEDMVHVCAQRTTEEGLEASALGAQCGKVLCGEVEEGGVEERGGIVYSKVR